MSAVAAAARELRDGLYAFDAGRDLNGVVRLLQICFRDELDAQDQRWLADLGSLTAASGSIVGALLRAYPAVGGVFAGYVWYEDGVVVGNANLIKLRDSTWVIANVATDPAYRRRGIARHLVIKCIGYVEDRQGELVGLQVRTGNEAAIDLYDDLGFRGVGAAHTYEAIAPKAKSETRSDEADLIRSWDDVSKTRIRRMLARAGALEGAWPPGPIRQTLGSDNAIGRLECWLRGRRRHRLVYVADGRVRGVAVGFGETRGGPHQLEIAVDPEWRGIVEAPLIDAVLRRLAKASSYLVTAELSAAETAAVQVLEQRRFNHKRTLERMVLDL